MLDFFFSRQLAEMRDAIFSLEKQQRKTHNLIEKNQENIMAGLDDVGTRIDAQGAKADKAFTEIRKALDDALAAQITQEELDAAVKAAKELQKGEDAAAVDAQVALLSEKLTKTDAALSKLDDIVADPV